MKIAMGISVLATLAVWGASDASACGGFFCGNQPVDQQAERIVFAVDQERNETTMIVQISYQGAAPDFAWVLPIANVPAADSLATFPQFALNALDTNTSPQIFGGSRCFAEDAAAYGPPNAGGSRDVTVHVDQEVGPYRTVVIESRNPTELVAWLRENQYNVTPQMEPYIAEYTAAGMKFVALRLLQDRKVSEIAPFRMTLPGTVPSIPLRMTAIAAEPEMGIVAIVLGGQRYEGANWPNLTVPDEYLSVSWRTGQNNYPAAVARVVDEAGGRGWVTDTASSTDEYIQRLEASTPQDEQQAEAIRMLIELIRPHRYLTRLYSRLSAEEMSVDPIFRRSEGGDVSRFRQVMSGDQDDCSTPPEPDQCDFVTCGAGGLCARVNDTQVGCVCVPGATARTTLDPNGRAVTVCQDQRMSFMNPGERATPDSLPYPDPCVGFDCGHGTCVAMNLTPTCVCDRNSIAVGSINNETGVRTTTCLEPVGGIPASFYDNRLPELADGMNAGRDVDVPPLAIGFSGGSGCSAGAAGLAGLLSVLPLIARRRRRRG